MNAPVILQFTGPPGPAGRALDSIEEFRGFGGDFTDTTMFQQGFANAKAIRIPATDYTIHAGFIATKQHSALWDAGHKLILASDFPADQDIYTWKPALGEQTAGWRTIGGPVIRPAVDGLGRDGLRIDHTAHAFVSNSQSVIDGINTGIALTLSTQKAVGGYGVNYIPHPTDPNGLFTTTFSNLELVGALGGLKMLLAGDSLNFWNIKTRGKGRGIDIEFIPGAESSVFVGLNSTSLGGALRFKNALLPVIVGANFELQSAWDGDADRALAVFDACTGVDFRGVISPHLLDSDGADCMLAKNGSTVSVTSPSRLIAKTSSGFYHFRTEDSSIISVKDDTE
jgi:hypothetical protein